MDDSFLEHREKQKVGVISQNSQYMKGHMIHSSHMLSSSFLQ